MLRIVYMIIFIVRNLAPDLVSLANTLLNLFRVFYMFLDDLIRKGFMKLNYNRLILRHMKTAIKAVYYQFSSQFVFI